MRYRETATKSAEILRLVIPRITQTGGNFAPPAYSVWYEHLAGLNPPLSEALEARVRDNPTAVPLPVLEDLYAEHIQGRDRDQSDRVHAALTELLRRVATTVSSSGTGVDAFAQALDQCEAELSAINDVSGLQRVIRTVVDATVFARAANDALRQEVDAARAEVDALKEQVGALEGEVLTDPLTGLRNRRGFEKACARTYGRDPELLSQAAILVVDIDHFKQVNDSYGHLFGDRVIRACAEVLTNSVKGRDLAVRFGGEEFLVLLPQTSQAGALAVAEQIRVAFSRVRIRRTGSTDTARPVSLSVGVAIPTRGETVEAAIERADQALYAAKKGGRNCVRLAGTEPTATAAAGAA